MGISRFVVYRCAKAEGLDGDRYVKKVHMGGGDLRCELVGQVKIVNELYEACQVSLRHVSDANPIIDIPMEHRWDGPAIGCPYLVLKVAHEQAGIARPHLGAHGDPTDLVKEVPIELEGIEGKHEFSKTDKGRSRHRRVRMLVEKELHSLETL